MMDNTDLYPYQRHAIEHIMLKKRCALFLDMGLGKTVITLTALSGLIATGEVKRCLVIAPLRVAENTWSQEVAQWEHTKHIRISKVLGGVTQRRKALAEKADIYVINRENVEWLVTELKDGRDWDFDIVVIDELSSFKNPRSRRFKALRKTIVKSQRVVGLTGTPAPNSLLDLWSQMYLIDTGERLYGTIGRYRETFFRPLTGRGHVVFKYALKGGAEKEIHTRISDICMSMRKEDYLTLPPLIERTIPVHLSPEELSLYHQMASLAIAELEGEVVTAANAATLTGKLLQIANGAVYTEDGTVAHVHDAKIKELQERVDAIEGSVLIAYAYRHDRDRIMKALQCYTPREIKTPQDILDWNNGEVKVLIGHPASIGHGLNLQRGGCNIIWFGLTWSLELYSQFIARLYRQGQTKPVIVQTLSAVGTIDETVAKRLQSKEKQQQSLIEAVKAIVAKYDK